MFDLTFFQEYEVKSKTFRSTLGDDDDDDEDDEDDDEFLVNRRQTLTMAQAVQRQVRRHTAALILILVVRDLSVALNPLRLLFGLQEKDLLNRFSVVSAENDQLLSQLGTARSIMARV